MSILPLLVVLLAWQSPAALAQDVADEARPETDFRIHGRFVDGAGVPVPGVVLTLTGPTDRINTTPTRFERTTGVKGTFELLFELSRMRPYVLVARHPDFGDVQWNWRRLPPPGDEKDSRVIDLGDIVLGPAATLTGFVVDAAGELLSDEWIVEVQPILAAGEGSLRAAKGLTTSVDPDTGRFEAAGLHGGTFRIVATTTDKRRRVATTIELGAGEHKVVELVDESPDPDRRLELRLGVDGRVLGAPSPRSVVAIDEVGRTFELHQRGPLWTVDEVPRGAYDIVIEDPRYERVVLQNVRTGTSEVATLVGNASLEVQVVDDVTGRPIDEYELTIDYVQLPGPVRTQVLRAPGAPARAGGIYAGVLPERLEASVRVAGRTTSVVFVDDLKPGEQRTLQFRVSPGLELVGRVVDADGAPLDDVEVSVTRGDLAASSSGLSSLTSVATSEGSRVVWIPARHATARTTADGRFRFEGLSPGRFTVSVSSGTHVFRDWHVDVSRDVAGQPVELALPRCGSLEVSCAPWNGATIQSALLQVAPSPQEGADELERELWTLRGPRVMPNADDQGRFPALDLCAGTWDVTVVLELRLSDGETVTLQLPRPGLVVRADASTVVTVDLQRERPAHVHLHGRAAGVAPFPGGVTLVRSGRHTPQFESRPELLGWRRIPSKDHFEREEWVLPGVYHAVVFGRNWRWTSPDPIELGATDSRSIDVTAPMVAGTICVRDEGGAPRPGLELEWWMGALRETAERVVTDAQGRFAVLAPAGVVQLARAHVAELDLTGRPRVNWQATPFAPVIAPVIASVEWSAPLDSQGTVVRDVVVPRATAAGD